MENRILDKIRSVTDVKELAVDELNALCGEIRSEIISTVEKNGGHLSSALGAVEAIVALCSVYDFSVDKIFFDVGHQSYALLDKTHLQYADFDKRLYTLGFQHCLESCL